MLLRLAINSFGRIGRCLLRSYFKNFQKYSQFFQIVALNATADPKKIAHYLQFDSIYGHFDKKIEIFDDFLLIDGQKLQLFNQRDPANLNWSDVDLVLECTGQFNKKKLAKKHLQNNVQHVLLSAPGQDADFTVIFGVNHECLDINKHQIISNSSCTSNCLLPILHVLHKNFQIKNANFTTIHSYTNDQMILDGNHKDLRRSRACNLSIIPTSTGACKTVGQIIPELIDKVEGKALRVPTAAVSSLDLTCNFEQQIDREKLLERLQNATQNELKNVLQICNQPLVSVDFIGNEHSCIIDQEYLKIIDAKTLNLLAWYDNEWAFATRMLDTALYIARQKQN